MELLNQMDGFEAILDMKVRVARDRFCWMISADDFLDHYISLSGDCGDESKRHFGSSIGAQRSTGQESGIASTRSRSQKPHPSDTFEENDQKVSILLFAAAADANTCQNVHFSNDVNFEELAHCTPDFNGAQCRSVCQEAVRIIQFQFHLFEAPKLASFSGNDSSAKGRNRSLSRRFHGCDSRSGNEKEEQIPLHRLNSRSFYQNKNKNTVKMP